MTEQIHLYQHVKYGFLPQRKYLCVPTADSFATNSK